MSRIEKAAFGLCILGMASPALAVTTVPAPAPIAGAGIGAALLVAAGYRAVKSRIGR
jgi:hypothetical protein